MPGPLEGQFSQLDELAASARVEQQRLAEIAALQADVAALTQDNTHLRGEHERKDRVIQEQSATIRSLDEAGREKDRRIVALESETRLQREKMDALGATTETLRRQIADARARDAELSAQLNQADELVVDLQQVIKSFESKAVFEWPQESRLSPELRGHIIAFLENGDMGGLENLLDRLIRYDDKLPTLLKHTYFKEKVEEVYGRYFRHAGIPSRRASDTTPGIPMPGGSGRTTLGFGPSSNTLGLLFIDLDNFKTINDTMGHETGDAALRAVAAAINETLRAADIKGRYGGEEIEVAVELENAMDGQKVAQKIVDAISKLTIEHGKFTFKVTASVGIAELQVGENIDGLIDRANWAMKYAKHEGKNRYMPAELEEAAQWAKQKQDEEARKKTPAAAQTP